jgi:hypothetical protein
MADWRGKESKQAGVEDGVEEVNIGKELTHASNPACTTRFPAAPKA